MSREEEWAEARRCHRAGLLPRRRNRYWRHLYDHQHGWHREASPNCPECVK